MNVFQLYMPWAEEAGNRDEAAGRMQKPFKRGVPEVDFGHRDLHLHGWFLALKCTMWASWDVVVSQNIKWVGLSII